MPDPAAPGFDTHQARSLRILRLIWLAMAAEVVVLGVLVFAVLAKQAAASGAADPRLLTTALAAAFGGGALGYFARMQAYKRHWVGDRIQRPGYFAGNLLLFGLIETGALTVVVCAYLSGRPGPELMVLAVPLLLLALNFPNGRAMLGGRDGRLGTGL